MLQIRSNTFETNSSSTHALCLFNDDTRVDCNLDELDIIVKPFTDEDQAEFNEPHVFITVEDKLRYFWTIYNNQHLMYQEKSATDFMKLLQETCPHVMFATSFARIENDYSTFAHYTYLEDYEYVLSDRWCGEEYLVKSITTVEEMKRMLLEGVIIFGDRDQHDYYGDSLVEKEIRKYTKISSVTG
jgi:hypothetical protein